MNNNNLEKLSEIQAKLAIRNAQVCANPIPHLIEAEKQVSRCIKLVGDLQYALSSMKTADIAFENNLKPNDIEGDALIRVQAAQKVLDEYLGYKCEY